MEVQLGPTRVLAVVEAEMQAPHRDRPNEGTLSVQIEFSPMADPAFEGARPTDLAVELGRIIDRGLRYSSSTAPLFPERHSNNPLPSQTQREPRA